jgi:RimJ/RimL family protein N-acetyltransferase
LMVDEEFVRRRTIEVSLRDGTLVRIRPILPEDKDHILDGFRRLSPESRYRRFLSPIDELTPDMLRELTEVDYRDRFAYGAFSLDVPGPPLGIGVARYVRLHDEPQVAEAAVTVVDDYQERGLGTLMLQALGAVALENGIVRFRAYSLETNRPLQELAARLGAEIHHESAGMVRIETDLPRQAAELRDTALYAMFRALARGEEPETLRFLELWGDVAATRYDMEG